MRFKNVKKTALTLAMFGVVTSSNAALFDYNATSDTEFDSPAKQGWMQDNTNNGSGVLTNADGMPAWLVQGNGGKAQWTYSLSTNQHAQASSFGWRMTTEMKVLSGGMITNYYANGTQRVLPIISLDSSGNLVVEFEGQTGRTVLATGTAATEYHKFELVFLPGSNPSASFYFDGKLIRDNIQPTASKQNMIVWGNGSSNTDGVAAYRDIKFEIQGDVIFRGPDRIPSIVASSVTPGVITAFAEKRVGGGDPGALSNTNDIITRTSRDGGITWDTELNLTEKINVSDEFDFSDPRPIYDPSSNTVLVSYARWPTDAAQNGDRIKPWMPNGIFYSVYDVASGNWRAPIDVTDQVKERSFQIAGWGGSELYRRNTNLNSQQDWQSNAKIRIVDGAANQIQVADGGRKYVFTLSIDESGSLVANLNGVSDPIILQSERAKVHSFHDYELQYSALNRSTTLFVDGQAITTWTGEVSQENNIQFGNADAQIDGRLHVQNIALTQQGQNLVEFDAFYLAQQTPEVEKDLEKLGWTKIKTGNTMSLYGNASVNPGPGHGITLTRQQNISGSQNGRLIYPAIVLDRFFLNVMSIYSDDGGSNWQTGSTLPIPFRWKSSSILETLEPSEADMVELQNGDLLLTARLDFNQIVNGVNYSPRQQFLSKDGGITWSLLEANNANIFSNISTGTVDASITRFEQSDGSYFLLFTNPQGNPAGTNGRQNLGLWFSFDEGVTWKGPIQLVNGASAYSDIYQLDSENAIVIVETDNSNMRILRLPITLLKQKLTLSQN
ncbi:sialidase [Vibrio cholerae]|nr:sialidase [Vibrio cholerae]EJL6690848.1 exo-alpha-sialidase [Vibrio cholerae]